MNYWIRTFRSWLRRSWDTLWCTRHPGVARVGGDSAWHVRIDLLQPGSVVIAAGAGRDVSFELEMAKRYGCQVLLFDPSPTGLATMRLPENQHPRVEFIPMGLAEKSGTVTFRRPADEREGSFSATDVQFAAGVVSFECTSLSAFLLARGIKQVDVFKLDIEGFEYGVLRDLLVSSIAPVQICVEFHDFLPGIQYRQTWDAIRALRRAGWRIFHKHRCDFSFSRKET